MLGTRLANSLEYNLHMVTVRTGGDADREPVAAMLARAFANDPGMSFIFPDDADRARRLPLLFREIVASDQKAGAVLMTENAEAATSWRGPGQAATPFLEMLFRAGPFLTALGFSVGRALALSHAIESHMPKGAFWYLHIAGCDPAAQGKGLGGAVIRAGLERAVGTQACYLETSTERNLGFYRSLGFDVTSEWNVEDGPRFWSMLRPEVG